MIRVVTGYDENGSPAIIYQGEPPTVIHAGRYVTTELWVSDQTPPAVASSDMSTRAWELEPPPGGTCFRIVEIAPGGDSDSADDNAGGADDNVGDNADEGNELDAAVEGFQHAHATSTLDYVTILSGQVTLVVSDVEVTLGPGDSVVQQPGVPHDWQNRSADRAVMVGVLLSAG
jgi:mannose-6-phosphate isomerase-like protein (cupin superfamily)